jgi:hypothetical protein
MPKKKIIWKRKFLEWDDLYRGYLPTRQGVYFVKGLCSKNDVGEIDVYLFKMKGLCCFCDDFDSSGTEGIDDSTDCHVSVQFTGLEFIAWKRSLNRKTKKRLK